MTSSHIRGARASGIALVAAAAVLWSTAGLFVRALDLDTWTVLGWRSAFAAVSLALVVIAQNGRRTVAALRGLGWPGLACIPVAALSMASYVIALKFTTVANVMVTYATVPFLAAGLAFVWIGERASARVLAASGVALAGIAVMAGGATDWRDMLGNATALVMTATFAVQLVMTRRYPSLRMAPVNAVAAAICALASWPLTTSVTPGLWQLALLACFGVTTTALAYLLFLTGGRHLPSGEAGLIGLLDVVLGPLWVWLAYAEQPGDAALAGGGLVLAAVLWFLSGERRVEAGGAGVNSL